MEIYFFAIVGMESLDNVITPFNVDSIVSTLHSSLPNSPDMLLYNNFNSFGNALLLLFQLLTKNDWHILMWSYVVALQTKWICLYFVAFLFIVSMSTMNALFGLIFETFEFYQHIRAQNKDWYHAMYGRAAPLDSNEEDIHATSEQTKNERVRISQGHWRWSRELFRDKMGMLVAKQEFEQFRKQQQQQQQQQNSTNTQTSNGILSRSNNSNGVGSLRNDDHAKNLALSKGNIGIYSGSYRNHQLLHSTNTVHNFSVTSNNSRNSGNNSNTSSNCPSVSNFSDENDAIEAENGKEIPSLSEIPKDSKGFPTESSVRATDSGVINDSINMNSNTSPTNRNASSISARTTNTTGSTSNFSSSSSSSSNNNNNKSGETRNNETTDSTIADSPILLSNSHRNSNWRQSSNDNQQILHLKSYDEEDEEASVTLESLKDLFDKHDPHET